MGKVESLQWLEEKLGTSPDVVSKEVESDETDIHFLYIKSICDEEKIRDELLKPYFEIGSVKKYEDYLLSLPYAKEYKTDKAALSDITHGTIAVFVGENIYLFNVKKAANAAISDATVETVIQGPQKALSEDLGLNLNLIRHRYHQDTLRIEQGVVGSVGKLATAIVYDEKLVDKDVLREVRDAMAKVDTEIVQAAGQLHQHLTKQKRTLFPTIMITERPDRVAYNLTQGKVIILLEGTGYALIGPAVFYDFMSTMEDIYQPFWISRFLIWLRYFGLLVSLTLPSIYVGVTAFNPELFRVQLALSIAGSRISVPYPAYAEVLFMLIVMEILTEASVRLPKAIGPTATTVGGLILGQAATEAGLVSNIMIIIVSAVAISNFVVPINPMSFAMRIVKYLLLAITTLIGLTGLVVGLVGLVAYLVSLDSFGRPFLKLFFRPTRKETETP
jgi:hypothetical protein